MYNTVLNIKLVYIFDCIIGITEGIDLSICVSLASYRKIAFSKNGTGLLLPIPDFNTHSVTVPDFLARILWALVILENTSY